ncbi:MAG: hypothetical protein U0892_19365 [Pirellulales bacterium]
MTRENRSEASSFSPQFDRKSESQPGAEPAPYGRAVAYVLITITAGFIFLIGTAAEIAFGISVVNKKQALHDRISKMEVVAREKEDLDAHERQSRLREAKAATEEARRQLANAGRVIAELGAGSRLDPTLSS